MQWWQVISVAVLPWIFERIWTIRGFKKVPKKLQPIIEGAAQIAVDEAIRRNSGQPPALPPVKR